MQYQKVEVAILCADDLKDVRHLAKMQTFAKAWVDPNVKYKTDVNELNGVNPVWNDKFVMLIPVGVGVGEGMESTAQFLTIEVYTTSFTGTKLVGRASIPLLYGMLQPTSNASIQKQGDTYYANYDIQTPSGQSQGRIYISYRFM